MFIGAFPATEIVLDIIRRLSFLELLLVGLSQVTTQFTFVHVDKIRCFIIRLIGGLNGNQPESLPFLYLAFCNGDLPAESENFPINVVLPFPSLPITVTFPPGKIWKTGLVVKVPFSITSQANCPVGALSGMSERLQARLENANRV